MTAPAAVLRILPALALLLLCGCPAKQTAPADAAAKPSFSAALAFKSAAPGGRLAKLGYEVVAVDGTQPLTLTDPKKPPEATLTSYYATVKVSPWVLKPKVTNNVRQECWVRGAWALCVRDSKGRHVGDFEVSETGALWLKDGTVDPGLEVESVVAGERSLYFVYGKAPGGGRGEADFVLEFVKDKAYAIHKMTATDGWKYEFENPAGTLYLHDAAGLLNARETLLAAAAADTEARHAAMNEWVNRPPPPPCTGGG